MLAALVLAAGSSSRLGRIKQLEPWGDGTLLGHVVDQVRALPVDEVWVVLGADWERIRDEVDLGDCGIVENPEWEEGIAASLRVGLDALLRRSKAESVLIVLGDQPDVPAGVVERMLEAQRRSPRLAVVPQYRYVWGNPVIVSRALWERLMSLEGDEGAKRLLQAHPEWVEEVWVDALPPRDVDTPADVEELRPRR
jgi:molybdenum cofactor cytidylyltransferase